MIAEVVGARFRVERGEGWELYEGDFRTVLAGQRVDHVITDPPYLGACGRGGGGVWRRAANPETVMGYEPADEELLDDLCCFGKEAMRRGWFVAFNDFAGTARMVQVLRESGAIVAEPIGWLKPPSQTPPRGNLYLPRKGTEFISVARWERRVADGACLPGGYASPRNTPFPGKTIGVTGGKPLLLMREIICDFTRPGEVVCDPCAGWGTTLLAAVLEGRQAVGAEKDPEVFNRAVTRLRAPRTGSLWSKEAPE